MAAIWDLGVQAWDVDEVVIWPNGGRKRGLPPLILFGYFDHSPEVPSTWWPPVGPRFLFRYLAYRVLFRTGNHQPPPLFDTGSGSFARDPNPLDPHTSLAGWRAEKEFRAAVCVHHIQLFWDEVQKQTRFSMDGFFEVGYTPPAVRDLASRPLGQFPKRNYKQGTGAILQKLVVPKFYRWGGASTN